MTTFVPRRTVVVWWFLVIATCLSLGIGQLNIGSALEHRYGAAMVVAIAFAKARYIATDFMEVRHAQPKLRWLVEAWFLVFGSLSVALVV